MASDFIDTNVLLAACFPGHNCSQRAHAYLKTLKAKPCTSTPVDQELRTVTRRLLRAGLGLVNYVESYRTKFKDPHQAVNLASERLGDGVGYTAGDVATMAKGLNHEYIALAKGTVHKRDVRRAVEAAIDGIWTAVSAQTHCDIHDAPPKGAYQPAYPEQHAALTKLIPDKDDVEIVLSAHHLRKVRVSTLQTFVTFNGKDFAQAQKISAVIPPLAIRIL